MCSRRRQRRTGRAGVHKRLIAHQTLNAGKESEVIHGEGTNGDRLSKLSRRVTFPNSAHSASGTPANRPVVHGIRIRIE